MLITKRSMLTGKEHTMDIPTTPDKLKLYESGEMLIQYVFPDLTPEQREFIKTGITPDEWKRIVEVPENE